MTCADSAVDRTCGADCTGNSRPPFHGRVGDPRWSPQGPGPESELLARALSYSTRTEGRLPFSHSSLGYEHYDSRLPVSGVPAHLADQ